MTTNTIRTNNFTQSVSVLSIRLFFNFFYSQPYFGILGCMGRILEYVITPNLAGFVRLVDLAHDIDGSTLAKDAILHSKIIIYND